jgi:hypothetical protein
MARAHLSRRLPLGDGVILAHYAAEALVEKIRGPQLLRQAADGARLRLFGELAPQADEAWQAISEFSACPQTRSLSTKEHRPMRWLRVRERAHGAEHGFEPRIQTRLETFRDGVAYDGC